MSSANLADADTEDGRCLRECHTTWRYEHGHSLDGGPFPGTFASEGDVRRCAHGRVWLATGRVRESAFFTMHDEWRPLSRWWTPTLYRRALRALAAKEQEET